jgi:hypothetical protein
MPLVKLKLPSQTVGLFFIVVGGVWPQPRSTTVLQAGGM